MYFANCTGLDIAFSVNLFVRYGSILTQKHWNCINHKLRYIQGTTYMSLFYSNESKQQLFRYANIGYFSDPHKTKSQTRYMFNSNGIAISWRSFKQTIETKSSNH